MKKDSSTPPSSSSSSLSIINLPLEILEMIFEICNGKSLLSLSKTCSYFYHLIVGNFNSVPDPFQKVEYPLFPLGWKNKGGFLDWKAKYKGLKLSRYFFSLEIDLVELKVLSTQSFSKRCLSKLFGSPPSSNHQWYSSFSMNKEVPIVTQSFSTSINNGEIQLLAHAFSEHLDQNHWNTISKKVSLSPGFIRKYSDSLSWVDLSLYHGLFSVEENLQEFENKVFWPLIILYQKIGLDILKKFSKHINWFSVLRTMELTEDLLEFMFEKHLFELQTNELSKQRKQIIQTFLDKKFETVKQLGRVTSKNKKIKMKNKRNKKKKRNEKMRKRENELIKLEFDDFPADFFDNLNNDDNNNYFLNQSNVKYDNNNNNDLPMYLKRIRYPIF